MTKTYLEPAEIGLVEEAAGNLRDKLMVRLLFHLGCRVSEALAIEEKDVDFETGLVTIEHLKTRLKLACPKCGVRLGRAHTFCPGCGGKVDDVVRKELEHRRRRTLPLDKVTLDMLRDYIERGGPPLRDGRTLIFGINRHRAWQVVRDCALRAGLGDLTNPETGKVHSVSPHRLRDAFAVHAVKTDDTGDGLRLLQVHLGHSSFNTTARYRKVSGDEQKEWYGRLWNKSEP